MKFFTYALALASTAQLAASQTTTDTATTTAPPASAQQQTSSGECKLQFTSPCDSTSKCGDLNGFNMTCIKSGSNQRCGCAGGDSKCQTPAPKDGVAYQFDLCTDQIRCVAGSGFTNLDADQLKIKTCAEPLYCVQEQNPNAAAVLKSICHTCGSCKTQNVKNTQDPSETRFDCAKICPTPPPTPAPTTGPPTEAPVTRAPKGTDPATVTTVAPAAGGAKSTAGSFVVGVASFVLLALVSI
ncbi:Aste57867_2673 [Aphanomyces stellatus]|uniref:Aste57867_2673 protein n=1 Tax=Aphanomyces stellatus TaxID=120398 RepID=A0A485KDA1_9STRA|nr:hypothetical protein As57867_002666 [Aphanomyces stellatus]VFT79867.1 Aste57867_2673 [Aphanomyces stellatus]